MPMFTVTRVGPDRLDINMSGKLDAGQMRIALDELVEKSKDINAGKMLFEVVDFHLPTLEAIGVEFARFPSMFGWIRKFQRAAILVDKAWVRRIGEIEGALIPGLEIRGFSRNDIAVAEAWLESSNQS